MPSQRVGTPASPQPRSRLVIYTAMSLHCHVHQTIVVPEKLRKTFSWCARQGAKCRDMRCVKKTGQRIFARPRLFAAWVLTDWLQPLGLGLAACRGAAILGTSLDGIRSRSDLIVRVARFQTNSERRVVVRLVAIKNDLGWWGCHITNVGIAIALLQ